jgi:hypothetical protein
MNADRIEEFEARCVPIWCCDAHFFPVITGLCLFFTVIALGELLQKCQHWMMVKHSEFLYKQWVRNEHTIFKIGPDEWVQLTSYLETISSRKEANVI